MIGPEFEPALRDARQGNEDAFAVLWRDLHPQMLRYLTVSVGDAAEDVASETWARIARDLDRFEGDELGFRSWAFTIARHRAVDWRRHEARRPADPQPAETMPEEIAHDDPADAVVEGFTTQQALELIATLPPLQAEVVALRVIAGLDVQQVAEIMDKRPGAIRVLAHRGLHRLAEQLARADTDPEQVTP
jgi:RNA polymerase sigma-70 factor (ECF subfamily)